MLASSSRQGWRCSIKPSSKTVATAHDHARTRTLSSSSSRLIAPASSHWSIAASPGSRELEQSDAAPPSTSNHDRVSPGPITTSHQRVLDRTLRAAIHAQTELQNGGPSRLRGQAYTQHGWKRTPQRNNEARAATDLRRRSIPLSSSSLTASHRRSFTSSAPPSAAGAWPYAARPTLADDSNIHAPNLLRNVSLSGSDPELRQSGKATLRTGTSADYDSRADVVLSPGCWVESMDGGVPTDGVFLGKSNEKHDQLLILSSLGVAEYQAIKQGSITCIVPQFISSPLAQRCLLLNPSDPSVLPIIQSLRQFSVRIEDQTRALISLGALRLYELCLSHAQTPHSIDCRTALDLLGYSGEHKPEVQLAIHRLMMQDAEHFIADPALMRTTGTFQLRPHEEVEVLVTVRSWVRQRSPQIMDFVDRAAQVRQHSLLQGTASPSIGTVKPLLKNPLPDVSWNKDDLRIIDFLRFSAETPRALQRNPYLSTTPSIIKLVDAASDRCGRSGVTRRASQQDLPRDKTIDRLHVYTFLAELGALPPWENWVVQESRSLLQPWDTASASLQNETQSLQRSSQGARTSLPIIDALDDVRHDFGSLNVYTIDDASARELDDGISIEPIAASRAGLKTWWIHVHIADPTALLSPEHSISRVARTRVQTEYFPERTWSMLPSFLVDDGRLSLGAHNGGLQRTMSFSTLVDETGRVVDGKVTAGVVRNVKRYTYGAVNAILGHAAADSNPTRLEYPLSGDATPHSQPSVHLRETDDGELAINTPDQVKTDLDVLHKLARALLRRRADNDALFWQFPSSSVTVSPPPDATWQTSSRPTFYSQCPLVTLHLPAAPKSLAWSATPLGSAQMLVSEAMVAANRTAAKFCVERGLPVPFRVQDPPRVSSTSSLSDILALRKPETGEANASDIVRLGIDFLPGKTQAEPGVHWPMGIRDSSGYVRVTSPLRRYSDLFSHWQLKSALSPGAVLPLFSRDQVHVHAREFDASQKQRARLSKNAENFWAMYILRHKFQAAQASQRQGSSLNDQDPYTAFHSRGLTALALRGPSRSEMEGSWRQPVLLRELGVRGTLISYTAADAIAAGDSRPVTIQCVDHRVLVEPRAG
ncbi:BQ5605_C051g12529 [Microbotryum silenes-dioicae]|uniref:BQ5605_C051g12529 protein n=1 Tax=Microbotryum silenes-dioicae TaxID=796604 RepID=A0A2X0NAB7_9BASI|nr:BQ5605_C051g12529 [Microbotryum silenes-dioicae]